MRARHPLSAEHTKKSRAAEKRGTAFHAGLVDALIEIGREREAVMNKMREALLRGDDDAALEHARELTGVPRRATSEMPVQSVKAN